MGGTLCFAMWLLPRFIQSSKKPAVQSAILRQTISDTNFVTGWVIIAFLLFEVSLFVTGYELAELFDGLPYGCHLSLLSSVFARLWPISIGPTFLSGVIPYQHKKNAISNDGDAIPCHRLSA